MRVQLSAYQRAKDKDIIGAVQAQPEQLNYQKWDL
jgi:hypothetical protein